MNIPPSPPLPAFVLASPLDKSSNMLSSTRMLTLIICSSGCSRRHHGKTTALAGFGAAGHRIGSDIRRGSDPKTGRGTQKDFFVCVLGAHGCCRRVDHREPTRITFHAAARRPGYWPRPVQRSTPFPQSNITTRSQAHETLGAMTTIIMRTSHDTRGQLFLALFQGFPILGKLPITLVSHEAPTGTRK